MALNNNINDKQKQLQANQTFKKRSLNGIDVSDKIKPQKGKGYIVKNSLLEAPIEYAKDLKSDVVNVKKGLEGKSRDHYLGRINDLAMKTGSLALGIYLFTKKSTPKTKAMEFIGPLAFFGTMFAWPRIAIAAPMKAATGVDMFMQYQDSEGRKKYFFQDPQYTPWDLVSKEDMDKMAKKMNVPDDTPNRDEVVKEKANKLALQGNTLWMLTAGFATPVGAALLCNLIDKPVTKGFESAILKSTKEEMEKLVPVTDNNIESYKVLDKKGLKNLNKILENNENASLSMNSPLLRNIVSTIAPDNDKIIDKAIAKDIIDFASKHSKKEFDSKEFINFVLDESRYTNIDGVNAKNVDILKKIGISPEELRYQVENISSDSLKNKDELKDFITSYNYPPKYVMPGGNPKADIIGNIIETAYQDYSKPILNEEVKDYIQKLNKTMDVYAQNEAKFMRYMDVRIGDRSETFIANCANDYYDAFFDSLGIKGAKLKEAQKGLKEADEVVNQAIISIASDDNKYKKAVKNLSKVIENLENALGDKTKIEYQENVDKILAQFDENSEFKNVAKYMLGEAKNGKNTILADITDPLIAGSRRQALNTYYDNRVNGIKAMFYRPLLMLDLEKRIQEGSLEEQFKTLIEKQRAFGQDKLNYDDYPRIEEICRNEIRKSKVSDQAQKFNLYSPEDYKIVMKLLYPTAQNSQAIDEVIQGKKVDISVLRNTIKNEELKNILENTVASMESETGSSVSLISIEKLKRAIKSDSEDPQSALEEFQKILKNPTVKDRLIFSKNLEESISPSTLEAIGGNDSKIVKGLSEYASNVAFYIGDDNNPLMPNHKVFNCNLWKPETSNVRNKMLSCMNKDNLSTESVVKLTRDGAMRKSNSKAWMNRFGTLGLALVGTTAILVSTLIANIKKSENKQQSNQA